MYDMALIKKNKKPQDSAERVKYYHSKYDKYSRAIGVMWAILVVFFLIITLVCLIQPTWLGAGNNAPGAGYFGLWRYFRVNQVTNEQDEVGVFLDFGMIPSAAFQAATAFVGLTVLLTIICVFCLFLFCCISSRIVFMICAWILVVDGKLNIRKPTLCHYRAYCIMALWPLMQVLFIIFTPTLSLLFSY